MFSISWSACGASTSRVVEQWFRSWTIAKPGPQKKQVGRPHAIPFPEQFDCFLINFYICAIALGKYIRMKIESGRIQNGRLLCPPKRPRKTSACIADWCRYRCHSTWPFFLYCAESYNIHPGEIIFPMPYACRYSFSTIHRTGSAISGNRRVTGRSQDNGLPPKKPAAP